MAGAFAAAVKATEAAQTARPAAVLDRACATSPMDSFNAVV